MEFSQIIVALLAFSLGFVLVRTNTCVVINTKIAIIDRNYSGWAGIIFVMSWAALVSAGLSLFAFSATLAVQFTNLGESILFGGIALGLGAIVNKGCFMGSVSRIGCGNMNYVFTLIGMGVVFFVCSEFTPDLIPEKSIIQKPISDPNHAAWLQTIFFLSLIIFCFLHLKHHRQRDVFALLCVGVIGGLLFGLKPDWTYSGLFILIWQRPEITADWVVELSAALLFFGAVFSALLKQEFKFIKLDPLAALQSFVGGAMMGVGAALIPGGNDTLLLLGIPDAASYAIGAYAVMSLTIASYFYLLKRTTTAQLSKI